MTMQAPIHAVSEDAGPMLLSGWVVARIMGDEHFTADYADYGITQIETLNAITFGEPLEFMSCNRYEHVLFQS